MRNRKKIIKFMLYVIMSVQIILSIIWMICNVNNIPSFGDSPEYINLSKTLVVDEYRTILYPALLNVAIKMENIVKIPFHIIMFVGQTGVCFVCIYYVVKSLYFIMGKEEPHLCKKIFYSLYILSIPMITFMNFSILTDSIALSMLLIIIIQCARIYNMEGFRWKEIVLLFIGYLVESMIRADRIYSCGLFIAVFTIIILAKKKKAKYISVILASFLAIVINMGVNSVTQQPGVYNRIKTNFSFILLDRIVWPNMANNYDSFSEEIRSNISYEEAQHFDEHNNYVMYFLAPTLEERVGSDTAGKMYVEMAKVVFHNQPGKVIFDVVEDFCGFVFTPTVAFLSSQGILKTNYEWNVTCCSNVTPNLTRWYVKYYNLVIGVVLMSLAILLFVYQSVKKGNSDIKKYIKTLIPFWGMCLIISLWFSIGDGAPPNDRYLLIGHITWTMFAVGTIGIFCSENVQEVNRKEL